MKKQISTIHAVEEAGLVYTTDASKGYSRRRKGDRFQYLDTKGDIISDEKVLARIRSLAVPPAYEDVWICARANGHLQATGRDARGRKQYRYHPDFRQSRDENKFGRMLDFAKRLPSIHERVDTDLAKRGMPREKVLASLVYLLEKSLIRIGSEEYAKSNKSFGLTTLRNRHVKVDGQEIVFTFLGKSKIRHKVRLQDRKLARIVSKLQELPGQELFQYVDEAGEIRSATSNDVNAYLKEISGGDFTAKDFRTWAGTVLCFCELGVHDTPDTKTAAKRAINQAMKCVAQQLGNTPAVCRKAYVHPIVVDAFTRGELRQYLAKRSVSEVAEDIQHAELAVVKLLRKVEREKKH
jgi:DNA topoisomerase-1